MTARRIIPYNPKLKALSRKLRSNSTLAEVLLWNQLKNRQVHNYRFLRQRPIDDFIVDFFCHELMLAIEIDGQTHDHKIAEDAVRQRRLESLGITVLRFLDIDVKRNLAGVMTSIDTWMGKSEQFHATE